MSTVTVELCGGNRKGIEKQDFDANKPDNENYITINLVPEKYKLSNLKITVGLLNQDWETIEADKYKLELQWSRVDMFYFSAGTVVKVVDTGDNLYYGYTKLIATNTDICDLSSIVVTGSKSGDFHQFVPYVVDDGLIGSSYEPPPFEHFASLIPGEILWLSYRFRKSPGFGTVTTGYRAPGITGGTITDRQWYIENLVYIYEVYYEGLTGWFFNSQCTVLNKGQWVFLNTDLVTSLENEEDFSIPYGTELDNAKSFILPMRIQGHGPPCDIWYNQSKYYSNIRYAKATINNIDRNIKGAYYICADLGIKGSCSFYCQGPDIDPESGDQFLIGDVVLLMLGGNVSAGGPYGDITIIGKLPFSSCKIPLFVGTNGAIEYYANGAHGYTGFFNKWVGDGYVYTIHNYYMYTPQQFCVHTKYGTVIEVTTLYQAFTLIFEGEHGLGTITIQRGVPDTLSFYYNGKSHNLSTNGCYSDGGHYLVISWSVSINRQIAVNFEANKFAVLLCSYENNSGPLTVELTYHNIVMEYTFDGTSVSSGVVTSARSATFTSFSYDNGILHYNWGTKSGASISAIYYDKNDTITDVYTNFDGAFEHEYDNFGNGYVTEDNTITHHGILSYPLDASYGYYSEWSNGHTTDACTAWGCHIDGLLEPICKSGYIYTTFLYTYTTVTHTAIYIDDAVYTQGVDMPFVYDSTKVAYNKKMDAIFFNVIGSDPHCGIKYKGEINRVPCSNPVIPVYYK